MNNLLIFFAIPLAVIIFSIALQKILRNPTLVAGIIFAVLLVATFIINNLNFLVATIVYTIIAFLVATLTKIICRFAQCPRNNIRNNQNANNNEVITINANDDEEEEGCGCNNNVITANANIYPNNNGRTGEFSGSWRNRR